MPTIVLDLSTDREAVYDLPPEQACITAYEQHTRKNYSWWDYPPPHLHPKFHDGITTCWCGTWCAKKESVKH